VWVGDPTETSAILTGRTAEAEVSLVVMAAEADTGWIEAQRQDGLVPDADGFIRLELTDLMADTAYSGVLLSADGARRAEVTRFRTAPALTAASRKLRLGATSCMGGSSPDLLNLGFVQQEALDLFFFLGDFVYADGSQTPDDYRAFYDRTMARPTVQGVAAGSAVVATWDDHEVNNNWYFDVNVTEEVYQSALVVYRESLPQRQGPSGGLWRAVRFGPDLEVFVLDARSERDSAAPKIMSDEQLNWAIEAIKASDARFKLILTSVHITDHSPLFGTLEAKDRWQGYEAQRLALLDGVSGVEGVVFVTGDMHYAGVQVPSDAGVPGADRLEIMAGPSGSRINELVAFFEPHERYPLLIAAWCWALIELDPGIGEVYVQFIGDDGSIVGEYRAAL
jgi:alkaline phosphatase D